MAARSSSVAAFCTCSIAVGPFPAFPFDDAAQAAGRFRQLLDDFGRLVPKLIQQGSAGPDDREEHEGGRERPDDPRALQTAATSGCSA